MSIYPHLSGGNWLLVWGLAIVVAIAVVVYTYDRYPSWWLALDLVVGLYLVGMTARTHADVWPNSIKAAFTIGLAPALLLGILAFLAWAEKEWITMVLAGALALPQAAWSLDRMVDIANSRLAPLTVGGVVVLAVVFALYMRTEDRY